MAEFTKEQKEINNRIKDFRAEKAKYHGIKGKDGLNLIGPGYSAFYSSLLADSGRDKDFWSSISEEDIKFFIPRYVAVDVKKADIFNDPTSAMQSVPIYAFYKNPKITEFSSSLKLRVVQKDAFYECSNLQTVNLPDSVKEIKESAFYGCTNLEKFEFPLEIMGIYEDAFKNCSSLREITFKKIPDKIFIDKSAFDGCPIEVINILTKDADMALSFLEKCGCEHLLELPSVTIVLADGSKYKISNKESDSEETGDEDEPERKKKNYNASVLHKNISDKLSSEFLYSKEPYWVMSYSLEDGKLLGQYVQDGIYKPAPVNQQLGALPVLLFNANSKWKWSYGQIILLFGTRWRIIGAGKLLAMEPVATTPLLDESQQDNIIVNEDKYDTGGEFRPLKGTDVKNGPVNKAIQDWFEKLPE